MGFNICLQLGGAKAGPDIKGESTVKGHETEIDVLNWHWGMTQSASTQIGGGGGTGSADVRDLTIVKYVDASTPILYQYCFNGTHIPNAIMTCIKVGGKAGPIDYIKITMASFDKKNGAILVSSISSGEREIVDGKTTDRFIETITLNFNNVQFDFSTQKSDGSVDKEISSSPIMIGAKG
jgi:type VI secretion system secreted protein Hcp